MSTLILVGHDGRQADPGLDRLVGAAAALGEPVDLLLVGHGLEAVAASVAHLAGVRELLCADAPALAEARAETLARQLHAVGAPYRRLLAAHGLGHRAALARAAGLFGNNFLADLVALPAADRCVRPLYAGAVLATVQPQGERLIATLRASAFAPCGTAAAPAPCRAVPAVAADPRSRLLGRSAVGGSRPELAQARIVVAGGRGVGSAEAMGLVEALADHLGAAVGASRAAVDAGYAAAETQVGQTGKTVAPALYLAAGISGAIQHVAGIKDAKLIVAINKDPDAPIFSVADLGLVGDLFEVLPALKAALPAQA